MTHINPTFRINYLKVGFPKFMLNELSVPCCVHRILEVLHRTDGE